METQQRQDKLPPIKYTKRVGHLFEHVRDIHNLYVGYIVNSNSQNFFDKWVWPFVNIAQLKGVIADEDKKQHQACVTV